MAETRVNVTPGQEAQNGPQVQILTSPQPMNPSLRLLSKEAREQYLTICVPLYQSALKGDWEAAKGIIEVYPSVVHVCITKEWETALHIAAAARRTDYVVELVKLMTAEDLQLRNKIGNTALCFAAAAGIVGIAKVMVEKNEDLPMIRGSQGMIPLHMAALLGNSDMVWYLYGKTKDEELTTEDRIGILNTCIRTNLYDLALEILRNHPSLAEARDDSGETALHVLARMPSAFATSQYQPGICSARIITSSMKVRHDESLKLNQALELVRNLWQVVIKLDDSEIADLIRSPFRLLFVAAEVGNITFLVELIRSYPDMIWKIDNHNRSIFHVAVLNRHESIYNLLYELGSIKDLITSFRDEHRNTILHLAAKIAPPNQLNTVSGAALQMQRELLWFKEVEKIVVPSYRQKVNKDGKTPQALFTEEHKDLVEKGEDWMKHTASQSMLVATLITTVVFAAAFTVPGGTHNDTGYPVFINTSPFMVFAVSDAIALFTSSTSILMFLSILTSRYAENDFLESLPSKLMIGLTTLFLSIMAMMVAFSATFFIVCHHNLRWFPVPVAALACVPVVLFAKLQYPLLADVIHSTYGSRTQQVNFYSSFSDLTEFQAISRLSKAHQSTEWLSVDWVALLSRLMGTGQPVQVGFDAN
ncbi:hypothetical protein LguiA_014610 [Lonicera macranthoides]